MRNTSKTDWLPSVTAERRVGISRRALDTLKIAGVISPEGSRVSTKDVNMLIDWKNQKTYTSGKKSIDLNGPIGLAVPLTDPDLSPGLELSESNGHADALACLQEQGLSVRSGQILTGWWSCVQAMTDRLVADRAPILGITGNFVVAGGWIEAHAATLDTGKRKAFLLTRMSDSELEDFRGFVANVNQSGTYISLQ